MKPGTLLFTVAAFLVAYGIFGFDRTGTTTRPAYFIGIVLMVISLGVLVRSGWRGDGRSWIVAGIGSAVATWTVYELLRQSLCPLVGDEPAMIACLTAFGEMTAPVLSYGVGLLVLAVGWARLRRLRPT